jgi:hypothetical protein
VILDRCSQMAHAVPVLVVIALQARVVRLTLDLLAAFARQVLDENAARAPAQTGSPSGRLGP